MAATIAWVTEAGDRYVLTLDTYEEETHNLTAECTKFPVESGPPVTDQVRLGNRTLQLTGFVSNTPLPENEPAGSYEGKDLALPATQTWEGKSTKLDIPSPPIAPNAAGVVSAGFNALFGSAPEALIRRKTGERGGTATVQVWSMSDPNRSRVSEVWTLLEKAWRERLWFEVATKDFGLIDGLVLTNVVAPVKAEDGDGAPFSLTFEQIQTVSAQTVEAPKPLEKMSQPKKPKGSKATKPETLEDKRKRLSLALKLGVKALEALDG